MKRRRVTLALLGVFASASGVAPTGTPQSNPRASQAAPTRDPAGRPRAVQPTTGSAVISGIVTALSDQPIGEATVTIYAPGFPDGRLETTADSQGRFAFSDLPAGRYTIAASKPGFVNARHGQHRVGGAGRAIPVGDGERLQIKLQLARTSVITGVVVDERGNPAVNAAVRAMRFSMSYGYRRAEAAGHATTDDRGIYRIHSLQPGDYAVCVATRTTAPLNAAQRLRAEIDRQWKSVTFMIGPPGAAAQKELAPRLAVLEARLPAHVDPVLGYAPVCHPGSASLPSQIRVGPEEERPGVDFQLTLTRLARIEGVVSGNLGADLQLEPITLINADEMAGSMMETVRADFEGKFTFSDVMPGRYRLLLYPTADGRQPDRRFRAEADITVAGTDIDNVVLQFRQGTTVTGQVVFQGAAVPPAKTLSRLQVRLEPATPNRLSIYSSISSVTPDEMGRFTLLNVFPGDYRISVGSGEAIGWFFDGATLAGQDLLEQPLAVKGSESVTGVVLTMTDQRAVLTGSIVNSQGEPAPEYLILVYPADQKYWTPRSHRMPSVRAKPDGTYVINGLRAGQYRVATLLDPEYFAWFEAEYLRQLESASIPLTIGEAEKKVLNLRVPR